MNILEKYDVLKNIALTKQEADSYFKQSQLIPMLYPVVYCTTAECAQFCWQYDLEILPYLDVSRIHQVWGIDYNSILLHKRDDKNPIILKESHGHLPDLQTLKDIFRAETKINLCLFALQLYGVENIEFIDSSYAYMSEESLNDGTHKSLMRTYLGLQTFCLEKAYIRPVL